MQHWLWYVRDCHAGANEIVACGDKAVACFPFRMHVRLEANTLLGLKDMRLLLLLLLACRSTVLEFYEMRLNLSRELTEHK